MFDTATDNSTFKTNAEPERYDAEGMDPGGIVSDSAPAKQKRTRKAKDGGATDVKAEGGESSGGIFLLVDAEKKAETIQPGQLREAVAKTVLTPSLTLYKAFPVDAELVVK